MGGPSYTSPISKMFRRADLHNKVGQGYRSQVREKRYLCRDFATTRCDTFIRQSRWRASWCTRQHSDGSANGLSHNAHRPHAATFRLLWRHKSHFRLILWAMSLRHRCRSWWKIAGTCHLGLRMAWRQRSPRMPWIVMLRSSGRHPDFGLP